MLSFLRKSLKSWAGLLVLGLALMAMVVTLFYGQAPGPVQSRGTELARVGGAAVGETDLTEAVNRALERQREDNPGLSMPEFVRLGGADLVLEQLLVARALDAFGAKAGVPVGRRLVDGEIASLPAAQVNGAFDEATFRRLLSQQRISEEELRRSLASDILRRLMLEPAARGVSVPGTLARPFADLLLEERTGTILAVPSALMPAPAMPDDKTLTAFWESSRESWTVPERRAFRHAMVEVDAAAPEVLPTDAEVEAYYKANPKQFGGVEIRTLEQVVLPDAAAARAFADAVGKGETFADAAARAGFAPSDTALGALSEADLAAQTNAAVARAAFGVAQGAITAPVKGPLGWHVVRVAEVTPARGVPLGVARSEILPILAQEKREKWLADRVAAIEDRLADGEPLGEVAKAYGLVIVETPPTTADGRVLDARNMLVPAGNPLVARAFATDPADGAVVVEPVKGQFAVLEVTEVVAPAPIPLAAIRPRVIEAYVADAREKAAKAAAEALAKEGGDLAAAAAARGLPPPQRLTVRRLELSQMAAQGQDIPPPVLLLLNVPAGQARVASAPGGQGWFVVRTDATKAGDAGAFPQLVEEVRSGMAGAAGNEMAETFARAVQRSVGTVRQPAAIAAVKRRLTGAGEGDTAAADEE